MRKQFILYLIFSLFACKANKNTLNLETGLHGKVKTITKTSESAVVTNDQFIKLDNEMLDKVKTIKKYSSSGELSRIVFFFDNKVMSEVHIESNSKGLITSQKYYNANDVLTKFSNRLSDTLVLTMTPNGDTLSKLIEYRLPNRVSKSINYNYQDDSKEITLIKRNKKNWIIESHHTMLHNGDTLDSKIFYTKYPEVDTRGNWIRSHTADKLDSDTVSVKIRKIEYY